MSNEGKYTGLFAAANRGENPDDETIKKSESQKVQKSESSIVNLPDKQPKITEAEKKANLCIKIPKSWRNYWIGQARQRGTTITAMLTEYLTEEFGTPDE